MPQSPERSRAWTLIVLGALMTFVAPLGMLYDGSQKRALLAELRRDGRKVVASVTATSPSYSRDRKVSYTYQANGRSYRSTEDASDGIMARAQREGDVEVLYSAAHPERKTIDPERIRRSADALLSWGPWFAVAFGVFCGSIGLHHLRRLN